jgi:hypothetical protein
MSDVDAELMRALGAYPSRSGGLLLAFGVGLRNDAKLTELDYFAHIQVLAHQGSVCK